MIPFKLPAVQMGHLMWSEDCLNINLCMGFKDMFVGRVRYQANVSLSIESRNEYDPVGFVHLHPLTRNRHLV